MKNNLQYHVTDIGCYYLYTKAPETDIFYVSHIHNDYELLFFYDGDVEYIIEGAIYHLQKNTMLLIQPAVYHNLRILSSRPYERIVINFNENILREDLIPIVRNAAPFYLIDATHSIKRMFDAIRDNHESFSKGEFLYLSQTTVNNIFTCLKYYSDHTVRENLSPNSTLERILMYIDEHPTQPLTIASLSEKFNLSESWIAHSFKKHLGISPSQYINRKKIIYAQSLINMGMPPVQAAEVCSYINYTTFYRQYKKYLGIKPAQDRKNESFPSRNNVTDS